VVRGRVDSPTPECRKATLRLTEYELLFSDNGPAIPRGVGRRIFEPLFSRKENGRGMGLTIARHLLEAHGGSNDILLDGRLPGKLNRLHDQVKSLKKTLNGSTDPASRKALDQLAGAMAQINDSLRMLAVYSNGKERRRAIRSWRPMPSTGWRAWPARGSGSR